MSRFEAGKKRVVQSISVGGGIVAYVSVVTTYTSVQTALVGLAVLIGAIVLYLLNQLQSDVADKIADMKTRLDAGFQESLSALDGADGSNYPARTDGGSWERLDHLRVEKVEFSGIPSFAGAAAGSALGAIAGGPIGAAVGGLIGVAGGGGKEYRDLRDEHQTRIQQTALTAVQHRTGEPRHRLTVESTDDVTSGRTDYWEITVGDGRGQRHRVRVSKSDGSVTYRKVVDDHVS